MADLGDEWKAKLKAEMEEEVERLLEQFEAKDDAILSDIERMVLATGQRVQRRLTERLVEAKLQAAGADEARCPECGGKMHYKGQKRKRVVTETGEMELERSYYYCEPCAKGFFPPGSSLGAE